MMTPRGFYSAVLPVLLLAAMASCDNGGGGSISPDFDPDGDGLDRGTEEILGTDPFDADSDDDGLDDGVEVELGTDPLDPDTDDDTLLDGDEVERRTDPNNPDTDNGGVWDGDELARDTDPREPTDDFDADRDGLTDDEEQELGTDPRVVDTDQDGLDDFDEVRQFGSNPLVGDTDEDGLTDGREAELGTDPTREDTDGDSLTDGAEVNEHGTNPLSVDTDLDGLNDAFELLLYHSDPTDFDTDDDGLSDGRDVRAAGSSPSAADTDEDGLSDADEFEAGTNPRLADTDSDGLTDLEEVGATNTNPLLNDTDSDGLDDGVEVNGTGPLAGFGVTDPLNPDTDADGVRDGAEMVHGSNPLESDTDNDGLTDGYEVFEFGTDPTLADSDGDLLSDGDENERGTNPRERDTDRDGLDDGEEVLGMEVTFEGGATATYFSNPLARDSDLDAFNDFQEVRQYLTDPSNQDTDEDGLTDVEELLRSPVGLVRLFDPLDPLLGAADGDPDGDGLSNRVEIDIGSDPSVADTDRDNLDDGDEVLVYFTSPVIRDSDEDGVPDGLEVLAGTFDDGVLFLNPTLVDSDGDGIADGEEPGGPLSDTDDDGVPNGADRDSDDDGLDDGVELDGGTDPLSADSDQDLIPDGIEVAWGLNPLDANDAGLDPDDDGLTNSQEYFRDTDHLRADTDDDGMNDSLEIRAGLNPLDREDAFSDFDGDGVINIDEACPMPIGVTTCVPSLATNVRNSDTDGDGLADSVDVAPTNPDADGDGIADGDEVYLHGSNPGSADSDGDGLSDGDELIDGATLGRSDADGDGLADRVERELGTSSTLSDTDADGLSDTIEAVTGVRVVVYATGATIERFTDALVPDTDGDGLRDGTEIALGTDPTLADSDGDGIDDRREVEEFLTDPMNEDSDGDGIADGLDPSPTSLDADGDGIPDASELADGYNAVFAAGLPTGLPVDTTLNVAAIPRGWYRVAARIGPTTPDETLPGSPGSVQLSVNGRTATTHALRWAGARVVSSAPFRASSDEIRVEVTGSGAVESLWVEALGDVTSGLAIPSLNTFADVADTDRDGLLDGAEAGLGAWIDADVPADGNTETYLPGSWQDLNSDRQVTADETSVTYWLEAEQSAAADVPRFADADASNGSAVRGTPFGLAFTTGTGQWGYAPGMTYSIWIRARVPSNAPLDVFADDCGSTPEACPYLMWVTVDRGDSTADDCDGQQVCAQRMGLSNRWEWRYAGTYVPGDRFAVSVQELGMPTVPWELDRVVIAPVDFEPILGATIEASTVDAALRVEGVVPGTRMILDAQNVFGLVDPMEADTDGDGYRPAAANCEIDALSCPTGTVPNSVGWLTDGREDVVGTNGFDVDSDYDADLYPRVGDVFRANGIFDLFAAESFARYDDAHDPWPLSSDDDLDGLANELEATLTAACLAADPSCPDPDPSLLPAGTDFGRDDDRDNDGVPDGAEDVNRDGVTGDDETNANNPDSDGDGLPDGLEMGFTTPRSRRYAADLRWGGFVGDADGATTTNPINPDTDGDGIWDGEEDFNLNGRIDPASTQVFANCGDRSIEHPQTGEVLVYATGAFSRSETNPGASDSDGDLLSDREELEVYCTDPNNPDTDADGLDDYMEVRRLLTNPLEQDTDGDGLIDSRESNPLLDVTLSDPLRFDSDGDGLNDGQEVDVHGTDPRAVDTDRDGLSDGEEVAGFVLPSGTRVFTDPTLADTDSDGLDDRFELFGEDIDRNGVLGPDEDLDGDGVMAAPGSDPTNRDSDADGFRDGEEVRGGSDPTDPSSVPDSFDDAGGLAVDAEPGTYTIEVEPGGDTLIRLGTVEDGAVVSGAPILLSCPGRMVSARGNGIMEIRRSPDGSQEVRLIGAGGVEPTFEYAELGGTFQTAWTGETVFEGFDVDGDGAATATNAAIARPAGMVDAISYAAGDGGSSVDFAEGTSFYDICDAKLGGIGTLYLGVSGVGLELEGQAWVRPRALGIGMRGALDIGAGGSDITLAQAELEINLTTYYISGRASLPLPDVMQQLTSFAPRVGEKTATCLGCIDFTIDPTSYIFEFMARLVIPRVDGRLKSSMGAEGQGSTGLNEIVVLVDALRDRYLLRAQIEMGIGATSVDARKYTFDGQFEFDGAGQVEFKPAATRPELECVTNDDCLFGQSCITQPGATESYCVGCAPQFDNPPIKPRFDVYFADAGAAGDTINVRVFGTEYACLDGTDTCDRTVPSQVSVVRTFDETINVGQNGLRSEREMVRLLQDELRLRSQSQCPGQCHRRYTQCARESCGVYCFDEDSAGCTSCLTGFGSDCQPLDTACEASCDEGLPVHIWSNDRTAAPRVTIDSDDMQIDLNVEVTLNGGAACHDVDLGVVDLLSCPVVGVSERQYANGQLGISGGVSFPIPSFPAVNLGFVGEMVVDLNDSDNDPRFVGVNGQLNATMFGFPLGNLGNATLQAGFDAQDEFSYAAIVMDSGLSIGPGGLIRLGGSAMVMGYDHDRYELCAEGEMTFGASPVVLDASALIRLPIDPVTDEFDSGRCGVRADFQLAPAKVPFLQGLADIIGDSVDISGTGAVECDGSFEFLGAFSVDPEFLPGFPMAAAEFRLSDEGVGIAGQLELPAGLGTLAASGELNSDGTFAFDLEGSITPGGFEMAEVRGSFTNAGIELHGVIRLPGDLAVVEVEGYIRANGDFLFSGVATLSVEDTRLTDARIQVSNDGASISTMLNVPGITSIAVSGEVRSNGYVRLAGAGAIGIGDAVRVGPITLEFLRETSGTVTISGSGSLTIAGQQVSSLSFSIGTDGSFSARGRFDLWIAEVDVQIAKPAGGGISFSASLVVSFSLFEYTASGSITLSYASGTLRFTIAGSISGPIVNFSVRLSVDSNGCFSVSELGRFCLG